MIQKIAVLVYLLLSIFSIKAQDRLWFDEINIDDGLSQSTILCMIQDSQGFIWVGTQYGLNRFDGYQFETYKNEIIDRNSISSNYIITMFEDSSGLLWIGTNNGLNSFDKSTNSFKRYLYNSNDNYSISNNLIASITEDQQGFIWIGTVGGGLNRFNKKSQKFERNILKSLYDSDIKPNYITNLLIDDKGLIWATTGSARLRPANEKGGIYQFDPKLLTISKIIPKENGKVINTESVTAIFLDDMKNLWFGTLGNGLIKKTSDTNQFSHYFSSEITKTNSITSITQDRLGRIWFASQYSGIYEFNLKDFKLNHYNSTNLEVSNLNDNDVASLLIDSTGVFWVGTWTSGIKRLDFDTFQFQKYLQLANDNHSTKQDVLDINLDSKGNVWLATWESGLLKLDLESGKTTTPLILKSGVAGLVRHIYIDKNDKLWIGSNDNGLIYFDPIKNTVKSYQHDPDDENSLNTNRVISIIAEPSGNLWIATRGGGLNYFNIKEEKFYHYRNDKNNDNSLIDDRVSSLFYDDNGYLWVGTNIGLDIFDLKSRTVLTHYIEGDSSGLLGKEINVIFRDRNKQMWVGTEKGIQKINRLNKQGHEKLSFTSNLGFGTLPFGSVGGILDDSNGNLWISGIKYIAQYNPKTRIVKNYNYSSGVLVGGYYIGSSHQDSSGNMYFGGLNGLTVFKADNKQKKTIEPKIILTRLLLFNKPVFAGIDKSVLIKNIDDTKDLEFNYKQNVFSLEFSALHYSSPKDNQYAYKLEGFDKQWVHTDSYNRRATYTNLDPGEYDFLLKASNNEGIWSKPIHKLRITIHAAPWKTKLAYFIYFILLSAIVFSIVWLRVKQVQAIKLRNEQLSLTSKLFENTSECVWLLDNELNFLTVNKGYCNITGFTEEETIGQKIKIAPVKGQNQDFINEIIDCVRNGGRWEGEMWAKRKSGKVYPIYIVIDRIKLNKNKSDLFENQFVGVFSDITQRKLDEENLRTMAYFDKLTNLPNRIHFQEQVQENISTANKESKFLIFYFDLDDFKNINDSLGHTYGDQLLVTIAKRLKHYSDNKYFVARLGGDEFAMMVHTSQLNKSFVIQANQVGNDLLKIIREKVKLKKHILHISASIGVSVYPNDGKNYEELLRNADTAMYDAKNKGRNNFTFYSKNMNKAARKRLMLEDELNKAIISQEIVPHYQPKVSLKTGKISGLEVLARWNHHKLGWIQPDEFIQVAEESRLINKISDQLLKRACDFLLPIINRGDFSGRMSFNLSMSQFLQTDVVKRIDKILKECDFPAEYLEIEITESMVMNSTNQAIEIMKQFQLRNINISIDDFGTGYSSLSYLKKFPINSLKIDISFIKDLVYSMEDRKIVTSIIQLAHNLGLEVIAEGGESLDQILILKEMGCEQLQGYYYCKALSDVDFLEFLSADKNLYES